MKKHLLFCSALFAAFAVKAQITVTTADVVTAPKTVYQSNDTMPTVSVGSAGASQTWNMTALNTHTVDTLGFAPIGWTPYASAFPMADMALQFGSSGQYAYLISNASALDMIGNGAQIDPGSGTMETLIQHSMPPERLIALPSTYNSNFVNDFHTIATVHLGIDPGIGAVVDSIMLKSVIHKTSNCDAWGNITTPLGSFAALRFDQRKYQTDSLFGLVSGFGWSFFQTTTDSTKTYSWWANSVGFPLVTADVDWTTNSPTRVQWLQATPTVGVNEYAAVSGLSLYPNPADANVQLLVPDNLGGNVVVFAADGKLVYNQQIANEQLAIATAEFSEGLYLYRVYDKNGKLLNQGKFNVVH